jgi:hypothetical protein
MKKATQVIGKGNDHQCYRSRRFHHYLPKKNKKYDSTDIAPVPYAEESEMHWEWRWKR